MLVSLGVEEEFLLVDATTGALTAKSHAVVAAARDGLGSAVTGELNVCQVEFATDVCRTLAEVHDAVVRLRSGLSRAASEVGAAIAAAGTHPFSAWEDTDVNREQERYVRLEQQLQQVARETVICGCHVHVSLGDRDLEIQAMGRVEPWLPVLLALTANSPYWQGADTGYASYRLEVWRHWPTAGIPPRFASEAEFEALVEELKAAGAIADATNLYWYLRPSARFPTLEFRICDVCLTADETVAVAGLVRALAWTAARDITTGRPPVRTMHPAVLDAAVWRAARYGLSGNLVHPEVGCLRPAGAVVAALLDYVGPGLDAHDGGDHVRAVVERIVTDGTGADRQRAAFRRHGHISDVAGFVVDETVAPTAVL